jgi:hypothetical protein
MSHRKSATLCVVCGDRVSHKFGVVVGRKPNGVPRLLCGGHSCNREWKRNGAVIAATWIENRGK